MAPKGPKAAKSLPKEPEPLKEYPTIAAQREAEYLASRPYQVLREKKGISALTLAEKSAYAIATFLETGTWRAWPIAEQKGFWKEVDRLKIPVPLPKPIPLGKDSRGVGIDNYTPAEYNLWERREKDLGSLKEKSLQFGKARTRRRQANISNEEEGVEDVEDERNRRKLIGTLQGRRMGRYEADPVWDDVVPIPQDDGEGALAQIAYTDEYAEAMGYLRAVMAAKEHSPRVLDLTKHIISLNAAHYTIWLYRNLTLLALKSSIEEEIEWVNTIALDNQKNYQIWHHRQVLVEAWYDHISSDPSALKTFADSEVIFMDKMFAEDSKNYHVWSYRQFFVRKFDFWGAPELESIERLLRTDVRNNSAWSHRFFVVFSDPSYSTTSSRATQPDPAVPGDIIDRELDFAKAATFQAPQNLSPWNYIRGVLRKAGRSLETCEFFASEFVKIEEEDVKSSHALDFLADVWAETGEKRKADLALSLLGGKYDRIRKNYWEWKRGALKAEVST